MTRAISVDKMGRVVLPSETRRRLNLKPGSRLLLSVVAERIELTPEPEAACAESLVQSASGRLVLPPGGGPFDATAAVRSERAAQARRRR